MITFYSRTVSNQPVTYFHNDTYLGHAHFTVDRPATTADRAQYPSEYSAYNPTGIALIDPVAPAFTQLVTTIKL